MKKKWKNIKKKKKIWLQEQNIILSNIPKFS